MYIQCSVQLEKWNQAKERAIGKDRMCQSVNAYVESYRAKIIEVRQELIAKGYEANAYEIKERLNSGFTSRMFLSEFTTSGREVGGPITQLTANKYHRLLRYMREYTAEKYRKEDILLTAVTYKYIDGLNTFMQTAHECRNNGAANLLCCLKNFILYAMRNDWIEKNPFQYYKMRVDKTNVKKLLTKRKLDRLIKKPMPNDRLERIRDVFVFCCLTVLAFTEVEHLRKECISIDEHGTKWIHKPREKTAIMSRIPLLPIPLQLLEKYKNACFEGGKLLPVAE